MSKRTRGRPQVRSFVCQECGTVAPATKYHGRTQPGHLKDINSLGIASVAAITVICYLVGTGVKVSGLDSKYIPVIVGVAGGVLGVLGCKIMPDFPATDIITAVAVGIVSGLAATGVDQVVKQLGGGGHGDGE